MSNWYLCIPNKSAVEAVYLITTNYDLSEGALFIISTNTGTTTIRQLNRALSGVQPEHDSCVAFDENDPDVADFIMGNSNE